MEILDLTAKGKIEKDYLKLFNEICNKNKKNFTDLIGEISLSYANNIDWLISSPASRNTINSSLYYNVCIIQFIKAIIKKKII